MIRSSGADVVGVCLWVGCVNELVCDWETELWVIGYSWAILGLKTKDDADDDVCDDSKCDQTMMAMMQVESTKDKGSRKVDDDDDDEMQNKVTRRCAEECFLNKEWRKHRRFGQQKREKGKKTEECCLGTKGK